MWKYVEFAIDFRHRNAHVPAFHLSYDIRHVFYFRFMYSHMKNNHHFELWRRLKLTQSAFFLAPIVSSFKFKTNDSVMRFEQITMILIYRKCKSNKINKTTCASFFGVTISCFPFLFLVLSKKKGLEDRHIVICAKCMML